MSKKFENAIRKLLEDMGAMSAGPSAGGNAPGQAFTGYTTSDAYTEKDSRMPTGSKVIRRLDKPKKKKKKNA